MVLVLRGRLAILDFLSLLYPLVFQLNLLLLYHLCLLVAQGILENPERQACLSLLVVLEVQIRLSDLQIPTEYIEQLIFYVFLIYLKNYPTVN